MKIINFSKMHALGNDFIVINNLSGQINLTQATIEKICNRYIGIGCDQLLVVEASTKCDFLYKIYNNDGSPAISCGNGARAFAKYIWDNNLTVKPEIYLELINGQLLRVTRVDANNYQVVFDLPSQDNQSCGLILPYSSKYNYLDIEFGALSVGNPHAIIIVPPELFEDKHYLSKTAFDLRQANLYKNGVNINFVNIIDKTSIRLKTSERGVNDFTNACGTGAIASAYYCYINGLLANVVKVNLQYGALLVDIGANEVKLIGDAILVADGCYYNE